MRNGPVSRCIPDLKLWNDIRHISPAVVIPMCPSLGEHSEHVCERYSYAGKHEKLHAIKGVCL